MEMSLHLVKIDDKVNHHLYLNIYECGNCGTCRYMGEPYKMCSGCKSVHYCSSECQKANWVNHKMNCNDEKIKRMSDLLNNIIKGLCERKLSILTISNPKPTIFRWTARLTVSEAKKLLKLGKIKNVLYKRSTYKYNIKHEDHCHKFQIVIYDGDLQVHRSFIVCELEKFIDNVDEFLSKY